MPSNRTLARWIVGYLMPLAWAASVLDFAETGGMMSFGWALMLPWFYLCLSPPTASTP